VRQDRPRPVDAASLAAPLAAPVMTVAPAGLRPAQAAQYLGVGLTFLASLPIVPVRIRGNGTGKRPVVIYLKADLDGWLAEQAAQREPTIRTTHRAS
jgi:hypothetical protein